MIGSWATLDQEMEAESFAYLVQAQKQEYVEEHEEVRLLSVRMTVIWGEGKGEGKSRKQRGLKQILYGRLLVH